MCGISGIIQQKSSPVHQLELEEMTHLVAHRGPDDAGYFLQDSIGLGHRRLSIIDLSKNGHQPMQIAHLVITYNGEIYNFLELKEELTTLGYNFQTATDTEVILKSYLHWGKDCVQYFNGMWAFAIFDRQKNEVFCSRDRFGIKPFYYAEIEGKFCFASEVKQFTAVEGWQAKMNTARAYEFLTLGWHDHTAETFFGGVYQLPQGCNLIFDVAKNKWTIEKYYDLAAVVKPPSPTLSEKEAIAKFQKLFDHSIQLRLRADVKTGSALSGGLDSSSIVGVVTQQLQTANSSETQETVSACFINPRFDESTFVDAVARRWKIQAHKVFPTADRLWAELKKVTWHQDEPLATTSPFAQYLVFEQAGKAGIKVMLDGQGADEILAGYDKFYAPFFKTLLRQNPLLAIKEFVQYFQLHHISLKEIWQAARPKKNTNYTPLFHPDFQKKGQPIFQRSPEFNILECSVNMFQEFGLPILLHYEDRNSMAHSVESRVPFLDYRLVEFCLSLPDNLKIKDGKRKYLLREAMKNHLPKEVYERYDKMGFVTPQVVWMEENSAWILEKISSLVHQETFIFSPELINFAQTVFNEKRRGDYGFIWRVLAFEVWVRIFIKNPTKNNNFLS